jgi:xylulokinase
MRVLGLAWPDLVRLLTTSAASTARPQTVSFLPFLTGERGTLAAPDSRAAWLGMDQATTRDDLARAALEALAFSVRRAVELLGRVMAGTEVASTDVLRLTGGGSREPAVQQLLADVLGRPVRRVGVRSSSATGAAVLAARGVGATLDPVRRHGPVMSPRPAPALDEAYHRWLGDIR